MAGLAQLALGTAPVVGGALLAVGAGHLKPPDYRGLIKQDMDLLDRLPQEATARRADLQHTIDLRIDALVAATHQGRALREAAASYQGNWRDVVLFVCTVVWWNVNHHRTNWLAIFIVLILLSILTAVYAARGLARAVASLVRAQRRERHET